MQYNDYIYDMEKISKYLTYSEVVYSDTAIRLGIDNSPDAIQLENIKYIAQKIFDPCREFVNGPLRSSSFFRSKELNKAIGGAHKYVNGLYVATSQHCKGEAIDIDCDFYKNGTNGDVFYFIKNNLDFDQLIWEYGTDEDPNWVHVSLRKDGKNRKQVLRCSKVNGRTVYEPFSI